MINVYLLLDLNNVYSISFNSFVIGWYMGMKV